MSAPVRNTFVIDGPLDLALTLAPFKRGAADHTLRFAADGVWVGVRMPTGPATLHVRAVPAGISAEAWGPGAEEAVARAPALIGAEDGAGEFTPTHPVITPWHRAHPGLRIPKSGRVFDASLPAILEQKVPGREARRAYAGLTRQYGDAAPGPAGARGLLVPPDPARLAELDYSAFHRHGVERKRASTVIAMARRASQLDSWACLPIGEVRRRLAALPGVGEWTVAEVAVRALGDADAVSVGDYHLPHQVAWVLAGERRADDARMLELLEPWRGHRARVVRLIELARAGPERRGPRMPLRRIQRH